MPGETKVVRVGDKLYRVPKDATIEEIDAATRAPEDRPKESPPTFGERFSESLLGARHPIDQAQNELSAFVQHPLDTSWKAIKQVAGMPRRIADEAVGMDPDTGAWHPAEVMPRLWHGQEFAQDVQQGNLKGAAGGLAGTLLPFAAGTPGGRTAVSSVINPVRSGIATGIRAVEPAVSTVGTGVSALRELAGGSPFRSLVTAHLGRPVIGKVMHGLADFIEPSEEGLRPSVPMLGNRPVTMGRLPSADMQGIDDFQSTRDYINSLREIPQAPPPRDFAASRQAIGQPEILPPPKRGVRLLSGEHPQAPPQMDTAYSREPTGRPNQLLPRSNWRDDIAPEQPQKLLPGGVSIPTGTIPEYVPPQSNASQRPTLFKSTPSRPEVKPSVPQRPANPVTVEGKPIDPNADLSDAMQRSIDAVEQGGQGGHAGGGVSSVEELQWPGKDFTPESTPKGSTHVTVKPNGQLQVNAGPELTDAQKRALRTTIAAQ